MRTSYKKNRPFDFKLIENVEPNPVLYKRQTGLSNYDVMKVKTEIWSKIAEIMNCDGNAHKSYSQINTGLTFTELSVDFCLMRWNNLHYQYRKESRRPGTSTWPYFERLRFLSDPQVRPQSKPSEPCSAQAEETPVQTIEMPSESSPKENGWQSYNDCVVMHVGDFEQHADSTFIIEEVIESNDQILQEEIIYEEDEQLENDQQATEQINIESAAEAVDTQMAELLASPVSDYVKMDRILMQLESNHRTIAERRIMAFVLKCQLRALVDEPIDDLLI